MTKTLLTSIPVKHRLPENMTAETSGDFVPEQYYITDDVWLNEIGKATVTMDSVVYRNGWLLKSTLPQNARKTYYKVRYPIKQWLLGKRIKLGPGPYLLATDIWSGGHFHWLCDVLPRLFCAREQIRDFQLLLPDVSYLRNVAAESFRMLQISFREIIWMQPGCRYAVNDLSRITPVAPSGHLNPGLMQDMRAQFIQGLTAGKRRVFISRSGAGFRKILNEEDLEPVLGQFGFEITRTEDLTFREQVRLFSETEWMMGLHGAGLTNACFMPSGAVIELRRYEKGPSNVGYWHLADALGLKYYFMNGVPDSEASLVGRGCNLVIPVDRFKNFLESVFH